jgi:hypothetical protein
MSTEPNLEPSGRGNRTVTTQVGSGHVDLPHHSTVSFETRDVKVRAIYWYLVVLTISVAFSFLISVYVLRYTDRFAASSDAPMMPARAAMGRDYHTMPPEPRLQGVPGHESDPQQDRRDKTQADNDANAKYGWIDEKSGVAQIPVKEAMKIIAAKGLNAAPVVAEKK